ncbi:hypothetical protein SDAV_001290 [Spiroplasma phoeniceum P40]|uniref:Uncharacterized protein n=1 Tax=Spiroplasma phoeniceum P40 TaxID=1276259 RepID=A0A345DPW9_9MOLU|nr:hypothetical protein SDAV_001290 [Spiroplasma phoeniceum P40]
MFKTYKYPTSIKIAIKPNFFKKNSNSLTSTQAGINNDPKTIHKIKYELKFFINYFLKNLIL